MRIFFSKVLILLGVFSLIMGTLNAFGMNISYADNLEIIGNEVGLVVNPSGTKLFNLTNLNPGDTSEAKIDIKNAYTQPFEVFMRTERMSPQPQVGEADLFEQLILTIYLDNVQIYSGSMKDYAQNNISLGNFNPGNKKILKAIVHLPGPETGNEFQGKTVKVKWIFIAQLDETSVEKPPEQPEEPEPNPPYESPGEEQTTPSTPKESDENPDEEDSFPLGEEEIVDEIPADVPSDILSDIPVDIPDSREDLNKETDEGEKLEVIDEKVPQANVKLPRTGQSNSIIYYSLGLIFVGLGSGINIKNRKY